MTGGGEFVWGVDVGVSKLAFAFAWLPDGPIHTRLLRLDTEAREGQRLGWLDRQVRLYAKMASITYPPACVWVEQPSGAHPKPQLMYAAGVVQAALFETLGCPVWTVPVGKWKRWAVGNGNASKIAVAQWAQMHGAGERSQDEFDAYGIAYAGRAMLRTGRWDAAGEAA